MYNFAVTPPAQSALRGFWTVPNSVNRRQNTENCQRYEQGQGHSMDINPTLILT